MSDEQLEANALEEEDDTKSLPSLEEMNVFEVPSHSGTTCIIGGEIRHRVGGVWMTPEQLRTYQRRHMTPDEVRMDEIEERLGVCTCGDAQTNFWEPVLEALRLVKNLEFSEHKMAYALLYFLERGDLVEHGSSIANCWLTTDGEWLMDNYQRLVHKS